MIDKDFQDIKLSALGFGAMRLPTVDGTPDSPIDEKQVAEMTAYAIEHGVNYFDTAYGYHDGQSEVVMGKVLGRYPRESYYLADKFPGYDLANMDKAAAIFEEQLQRCGVEYFDFYLLHNVYEKNVDPYMDEKYGIMDYLLAQKKAGRIRHLGFSAHGRFDTIEKFLKVHGKDMEFCQIQLNYLDWTLQDAAAKLAALRPDESMPAWAFHFLQSIDSVKMVLSGMSNLEQMKENIKTYEEEKPLTEKERAALMEVADSMLDILPCTACRYCTTHCPQELDIPTLLSLYNETRFANGLITHMAVDALPKEKQPSACIGCKSCEAVCPQQLSIAEAMSDFVEKLNQPAGL